MRKALITTLVMLGSLFSVAQAADVKFSGNVGYRNDNFEVGSTKTDRDRFRAQLQANAVVNEKITAVVGVSTGDGKSSWTDMGNENSLKNIGLDLAYVEYAAAPFAKVTLGKMEQPWHVHGLMFDQDINPEGLAAQFKHKSGLYGSVFRLKLTEEITAADSKLDGFQVGVKKKFLGANFDVHAAMLKQDVSLVRAVGCVVTLSAPTLPVCATADKAEFHILGASASRKVAGLPLTAFVEHVKNDSVSVANKATAYGVVLGRADKAGKWELMVMNQKSDANALSAIWTDSDFAGGNSAHDGRAIRGAYALADGLKVRGSYFDADIGSGNSKTNSKRVMFDLVYSF